MYTGVQSIPESGYAIINISQTLNPFQKSRWLVKVEYIRPFEIIGRVRVTPLIQVFKELTLRLYQIRDAAAGNITSLHPPRSLKIHRVIQAH